MKTNQSTFWGMPEETLLESLKSSPLGLTESDAKSRLLRSKMESIDSRRRSSLGILVTQFNDPIILLLFVSAVLSYFLDDATNAFIILIILVLSGCRVLGVAHRSIDKLELEKSDESDKTFAGFLIFTDPPNPSPSRFGRNHLRLLRFCDGIGQDLVLSKFTYKRLAGFIHFDSLHFCKLCCL